MNTTPDLMPTLSGGAHSSPREGACIMEMASFLAGEAWGDSPACTHPVLASAARRVNDALPDDERQQLLPLLPRLMGTAPTGSPVEQHRLSVGLAVWCAEQVVHLAGEGEPAARAAISTARAWLDGTATRKECRDAADAAYASAYAADAAAADAYAYADADADADGRRVALLVGLIDEHDALVGRESAAPLTDEEIASLVEVTH